MLVQQSTAEAYISAYMPVFGYIPKPAEETTARGSLAARSGFSSATANQ